MKNFYLLILIILSICLKVEASIISDSDKNAVFLDLSTDKKADRFDGYMNDSSDTKSGLDKNVEISETSQDFKQGIINMEVSDVNIQKKLREKEHDIMLYQDVNKIRPKNKAVSKSFEKNILKDSSVGATYSTTEKSGQMDDSVSVYSKYKKNRFAFTTAYSQSRDGYKENGLSGGNLSVSPELSLNNHIKLKNVYSENMSNNQQKNEMVLSIRPFKDDRMDLDLGAGQTFSQTNEPAKSQINIGTKFRF